MVIYILCFVHFTGVSCLLFVFTAFHYFPSLGLASARHYVGFVQIFYCYFACSLHLVPQTRMLYGQ